MMQSGRGIIQLRIYEVSPGLKEVFYSRFMSHAMRIMKRYDFEFLGTWESKSVADFEFVYLLKWPDRETLERQWELFLADPEWIAIKAKTVNETGEPVRKVTSRILDNVPYTSAD
jgi:hypothetical protein